jgi:hypothetical protein
MPPLSFSDEEIDTLSALAWAVPPLARDAFRNTELAFTLVYVTHSQ